MVVAPVPPAKMGWLDRIVNVQWGGTILAVLWGSGDSSFPLTVTPTRGAGDTEAIAGLHSAPPLLDPYTFKGDEQKLLLWQPIGFGFYSPEYWFIPGLTKFEVFLAALGSGDASATILLSKPNAVEKGATTTEILAAPAAVKFVSLGIHFATTANFKVDMEAQTITQLS